MVFVTHQEDGFVVHQEDGFVTHQEDGFVPIKYPSSSTAICTRSRPAVSGLARAFQLQTGPASTHGLTTLAETTDYGRVLSMTQRVPDWTRKPE